MTSPVISVQHLCKTYGSVEAVADVSFEVAAGTIFGLVGPNGAGKSTLLECIEGLRQPTSGKVTLLGQAVAGQHRAIFARVGVLLQENEVLPHLLRAGEIIDLYRSFYTTPLSRAEILEICGLQKQVNTRTRQLSGGQRRRLAVALAMTGQPQLIILDEPTSGLDPQARFNLWQALLQYRDQGGTVFLSTHYMDEAEDYCEELCLLDHGRIQIQGNPAQLMADYGMRVLVKVPDQPSVTAETLQALPSAQRQEKVGDQWFVYSDSDSVYAELKGLTGLDMLEMRPARLEDLYLMTTGRSYRTQA